MKLELTKKVVLSSLVGILIIGGLAVGGGYAHTKNVKAASIGKAEKLNYDNLQTLDTLSEELDKFYFNQEAGFLSPDISSATLEEMNQKITNLVLPKTDISENKLKVKTSRVTEKQAEVTEKLSALQTACTLQESVNNLFESPVISADQFNDTIAIKDDTTVESLTALLGQITGESPWELLLKQALDSGNQQLTLKNDAQNAMSLLIDEQGNIRTDVSRLNYEAAQTAVAALKEGQLKTNFTTQLATVLSTVESNEQDQMNAQTEDSYEDSSTSYNDDTYEDENDTNSNQDDSYYDTPSQDDSYYEPEAPSYDYDTYTPETPSYEDSEEETFPEESTSDQGDTTEDLGDESDTSSWDNTTETETSVG